MRVTARKYMGDDAYSWAVFVNGVVRMTGLSQTSAYHEKRRILREHEMRQAAYRTPVAGRR